jgi:CHAD domain-containing protein
MVAMSGQAALARRALALDAPAQGGDVGMHLHTDDLAGVRQRLLQHRTRARLTLGAPATSILLDTYLDTDEHHLRRAGCALRLRRTNSRCELTLEILRAAAEGLRPPREITERLASTPTRAPEAILRDVRRHLRGPVGSRVRAVAGRRPLKPLFEVTTQREAFPLRLEGMPAGMIALDDIASPRGRRRRAFRMHRIAVEVRGWAAPAVQPFLAPLLALPTVTPVASSTFEAVLRAHDLDPREPAEVTRDADAGMSAGEVAIVSLAHHLGRMLRLELPTRLGEDAEALHDMRVATRRLRAAIRLFDDALPARAEIVREELRIVGHALGRVRDLDVELAEISGYREELPGPEAQAAGALVALLQRRRSTARQQLVRVLDSNHYRRAIQGCQAIVRHGALRTAAARRSILAVAPDLITQRYRKLRKLGDRITPTSSPAEYHAVRIACKHLRYAVELHEGVYGKPARAWTSRLAALQHLLGDHQDAAVAAAYLRDLAGGADRSLSARAQAAAATLAERYEARVSAARDEFPRAYRKTHGKRLQRLRRVMDERISDGGGEPAAKPATTPPVLVPIAGRGSAAG